MLYSLVMIIVALVMFGFAQANPGLALPIVILGLALLAGGTWLFVNWCTARVEAIWPTIGAE